MITYCDNAVKLIALENDGQVRLMIRQTKQVLVVNIGFLEGNPLAIREAVEALEAEQREYLVWKKKNG